MKTSGVMICVPAYGQHCTANTMESLYCLAQYFSEKKIRNRLSWFSAADIVEVRNLFLTIWYDAHPDFSHLLFVDSDMGFPPELVRDMLKFDKHLTGVLYARRQNPPSIVGSIYPDRQSSADIVHGFLPAQEVGAGVMLITRQMVTEMLSQMPELSDDMPSVLAVAVAGAFPLKRLIRAFDPIREGNKRLSEDVSFCHRWRACGGDVWANVEYRISHVGMFDFAIRYAGILEGAEKKLEAAA